MEDKSQQKNQPLFLYVTGYLSCLLHWEPLRESTVYVTTAFAVPVKLITAVEPEQIVVEPEIDAVGKAVTVTVALAVCAWLQIGVAVVVTPPTVVSVWLILFPEPALAPVTFVCVTVHE